MRPATYQSIPLLPPRASNIAKAMDPYHLRMT